VKAWPIHAKRLTWLSVATIVAGATAAGLILFYAPNDADQGFVQKIFYPHVPMALVALAGFRAAPIMAIEYLRSGDRRLQARAHRESARGSGQPRV
jgi:heme exporter protein C